MPGFDGTGPRGEGPMTGGARGYCNPGYAGYGPVWGQGFQRGFVPGFGRGRGCYGYGRGFRGRRAYGGWFGPAYRTGYAGPYAMSREDEIRMLKDQAGMIKADLDAITKRMGELESDVSQS